MRTARGVTHQSRGRARWQHPYPKKASTGGGGAHTSWGRMSSLSSDCLVAALKNTRARLYTLSSSAVAIPGPLRGSGGAGSESVAGALQMAGRRGVGLPRGAGDAGRSSDRARSLMHRPAPLPSVCRAPRSLHPTRVPSAPEALQEVRRCLLELGGSQKIWVALVSSLLSQIHALMACFRGRPRILLW